jgi:hypothetical protein
MTFSIKGLFVTLSITALCRYVERRVLFIVMLNVVMLSVVAPNLPLIFIRHQTAGCGNNFWVSGTLNVATYPDNLGLGSMFHKAFRPLNSSWMLLAALKAKKSLGQFHRHLRNIDCLMVRTTCLVCFISTVNGCSKKIKKRRLL